MSYNRILYDGVCIQSYIVTLLLIVYNTQYLYSTFQIYQTVTPLTFLGHSIPFKILKYLSNITFYIPIYVKIIYLIFKNLWIIV